MAVSDPEARSVLHRGTHAATRAPKPASPAAQIEFLILLFPGYSQLCLSSLVDPLRIANSLSGRDIFRWRLASTDGKPVECASGIEVAVGSGFQDEQGIGDRKAPHAVVICSGEGVERLGSSSVSAYLRQCVRRTVPIYALGTATWLLAEAGLLDGTRCTIHWGKIAALAETFYGLTVDDALFVRDGHFVTCAGEFAAFDLAVDLVESHCGLELAHDVCRHLTADRRRNGASSQSLPHGLLQAGANQSLIRIVRLMEQNIEEPAPLAEISRRVGLSRRQIERLFRRHLSTTPLQYYLELRLLRARQLVELTSKPIMDIAVACGFVSSSHFSKSFREHFNVLPSKLRAA